MEQKEGKKNTSIGPSHYLENQKEKKFFKGNFALYRDDGGPGDEMAVSVASQFKESSPTAGIPGLSWLGWLARLVRVQPRQSPNSVLGLGAEIADLGQQGHVHVEASGLGSLPPRPGEEKGKDIVKCVHTTPG